MAYKLKKFQKGGTNLFRTNKTQYVDSVLNANKDKEWVRRLTQKNTPSIATPNTVPGYQPGMRSTHLMSDDDNGFVFPEIFMINGKLKYLGNKSYDYAKQNNLGIQLPKEQGTWFARNGYKKGTNVLAEFQSGGILGIPTSVQDNTVVNYPKLTRPAPEVNTTSEMLVDMKNKTFRQNPNARMGLEIVSPEFMMMTAGVGSLGTKATTLAGKIGSASLHGAAQGMIANASNLSGSKQDIGGLVGDIIGGGLVGGLLKGTGIGIKAAKNNLSKNNPLSKLVSEYNRKTFDPNKVNLKKYKPLVSTFEEVSPSELNIIDRLKVKNLENKLKSVDPNQLGFWDKITPIEGELQSIKSNSNLKSINKLLHRSDLGKPIGEGAFGTAYNFKYNNDFIVKLGKAAPDENPLEILTKGKPFANDPNIAIPTRVEELAPGKYAWVMPKMHGVNKFTQNSIPRSSVAEAALKIRALNKAGIGFDYAGDNLLFNPTTKKLSLIDLNVFPKTYNSSDWFYTYINKLDKNPVTALKDKLAENLQSK